MSNKIRVAAVVVALVVAGCVSSNDAVQNTVSSSEQAPLVFSDMHAAIPADKGTDKFFDYN